MSEREQRHAGVARHLGRLAGGRVPGLERPLALVLAERGLVDQQVGAGEQHGDGLGRRACRPV